MSLHKRCSASASATTPDGSPNPRFCAASPRCSHVWHYEFSVNGRRYRASTETADKQKARDIEAKERSRILDGRHGIRRQHDITFRTFAATYLTDHAEPNKKSVGRDREIVQTLNQFFGPLILHEITAHRIEQYKRDRLAGRWKARGQRSAAKPVQPATVNRELDTLKSILSKAVEWGKLLASPARGIRRLKVDNRRTRILTEAEQASLIAACPEKLGRIVRLALITGARIGELLNLRWADISDDEIAFLKTKNGRPRRLPISDGMRNVLSECPKTDSPWVFTNVRTRKPYTTNGTLHVFSRALQRAGIVTGDVDQHTLRHTALSRMVAAGIDDFTVMAISGHSSTRMLQRYAHPTDDRKAAALASFKG